MLINLETSCNYFSYTFGALCTRNPPKIAAIIVINPKIFDVSNISDVFAKVIIALTDDIAFVTDISGVCKDGVTLQTT